MNHECKQRKTAHLSAPEDKADSDLANGFHLQIDVNRQRQMQVLRPAGGWNRVVERFESDHLTRMEQNLNQLTILLIDFDGKPERLDKIKGKIPAHLADRVFVLGTLTNPEHLKAALGSYETVGSMLARDCRDETDTTWNHDLLSHNAGELERLRNRVRPILF